MIPVIINWKDNRLYLNFTNSIDCSTFNFYYCSTFWNTSHFLDLTVSQNLDYLAFRESQLIRILSRVIANSNHFSTSRGGTSRRRTNTICMAIALKIFQIKKRYLESILRCFFNITNSSSSKQHKYTTIVWMITSNAHVHTLATDYNNSIILHSMLVHTLCR